VKVSSTQWIKQRFIQSRDDGSRANFTNIMFLTKAKTKENVLYKYIIIIIIIIIIIMALQSFVGPWPLFQLLDPIHNR
jgi:hypothetical protein